MFCHMRLVVSCSSESMITDLTNKRLHCQVNLGVLTQVTLGGEPGSALSTHVRLGLVKWWVASVPGLGTGQQCDRGLVRWGHGTGGEWFGTLIVTQVEWFPCLSVVDEFILKLCCCCSCCCIELLLLLLLLTPWCYTVVDVEFCRAVVAFERLVEEDCVWCWWCCCWGRNDWFLSWTEEEGGGDGGGGSDGVLIVNIIQTCQIIRVRVEEFLLQWSELRADAVRSLQLGLEQCLVTSGHHWSDAGHGPGVRRWQWVVLGQERVAAHAGHWSQTHPGVSIIVELRQLRKLSQLLLQVWWEDVLNIRKKLVRLEVEERRNHRVMILTRVRDWSRLGHHLGPVLAWLMLGSEERVWWGWRPVLGVCWAGWRQETDVEADSVGVRMTDQCPGDVVSVTMIVLASSLADQTSLALEVRDVNNIYFEWDLVSSWLVVSSEEPKNISSVTKIFLSLKNISLTYH